MIIFSSLLIQKIAHGMKQNGVNGAVVKQPMIAEAVIDNVSEITAYVVITARLRATNHGVVFHQFISKSAM